MACVCDVRVDKKRLSSASTVIMTVRKASLGLNVVVHLLCLLSSFLHDGTGQNYFLLQPSMQK